MAIEYFISPASDRSRNTVFDLLISLQNRDGNQRICACSVLQSAFNHTFESPICSSREGAETLRTLLVLAGKLWD